MRVLTLEDIRNYSQIRAGTILAVSYSTKRIQNSLLTPLLVLLEAPFDPLRRQMNSVLLTVDLTKAVVDEAIERQDSLVVAYRMLISYKYPYWVSITSQLRSDYIQGPQINHIRR